MRTLIVTCCAIIGMFAGALVGTVAGLPANGADAVVGLAVGLLGGVALARQTYPRRL